MITLLSIQAFASPQVQSPRADEKYHAEKNANPTEKTLTSIANELAALREQQAADEKQRANDESNHWLQGFGAKTWSNWGLVILAAVASIYGALTLGQVRRQADAAERSARAAIDAILQNRAFITVTEVTFAEHEEQLRIHLRANGTMPAVITEWGLKAWTGPESADPLQFQQSGGLLAPAQDFVLSYPTGGRIGFSIDDLRRVKTGTLSCSLYGVIRYEAGYGYIGETGFGFDYDRELLTHEPHRRFATTLAQGRTYSRYRKKDADS
jgi:hypothetical protein